MRPNLVSTRTPFGSYGAIAWAPTLTSHDPNPPITIEGAGALTIAPPSITSTVTFGNATVLTTLIVSPPSIASTAAFGTAIVSTVQIISPTSIASGVTFGTAIVSTALLIQPPSIVSGATFGTAIVTTEAPPPVPVPVTFQRLVVECKTLTCDGISDTSLYSIQDPIPSRMVAAAECKTNNCTGIEPDSQSYSLQDALYFNGTPVTVVVTCPPGANCTPGSFPPTVTYPPGTFVFPDVPVNPGEPINLCLKGCQSTVCRVLPAGSSHAAIQAAANAIILEVAAQQAQCDIFPEYPFGTTVELGSMANYACLGVVFAEFVQPNINPESNPVAFSIIGGSLPAGITMTQNTLTAFFNGTPTTSGISNFTLRATAANGATGTRAYSITVAGITTTSLPDAIIGESYSETLAAVGITGTVIWGIASGSLPNGLTLNTTTGEISGTPTVFDVFDFIIFVQNSERQCFRALTIDVDVCLITTASPLPEATESVPYSTTLAATDITGTLTWSIISGALPAGLSLNASTGEIAGTPTTVETASFAAQVVNGLGNICSKAFQLEVASAQDCPDWSTLLWDVASVSNGSFTPSSAAFHAFSAIVQNGNGSAGNFGLIDYNGTGCNCNLHLELQGPNLPADFVCKISVDQVAPFISFICYAPLGASAGVLDIPFSLPDTLGATLQYRVSVTLYHNFGETVNILDGFVENV